MTDNPDMTKVIAAAKAWRKSYDERIPFDENWLAHSDDDKRMRCATPEQTKAGALRGAKALRNLRAEYVAQIFGNPAPASKLFAADIRGWVQEAGNDKHAWDRLDAITRWLLKGDIALPDEFGDWVADRLEGKIKRPRIGVRDPLRDWTIRLCIGQLLADHPGLHATRRNSTFGDTDDPTSACDAVAKAWCLSPDTVETIWDARPKT